MNALSRNFFDRINRMIGRYRRYFFPSFFIFLIDREIRPVEIKPRVSPPAPIPNRTINNRIVRRNNFHREVYTCDTDRSVDYGGAIPWTGGVNEGHKSRNEQWYRGVQSIRCVGEKNGFANSKRSLRGGEVEGEEEGRQVTSEPTSPSPGTRKWARCSLSKTNRP